MLQVLRQAKKFKGRMYADLKNAVASGDADAVKKFSGQRLSRQDAQNVLTAVHKDFNSTYMAAREFMDKVVRGQSCKPRDPLLGIIVCAHDEEIKRITKPGKPGKGGTGGAKVKPNTSAARASSKASPGAVSESSAGKGGTGGAKVKPNTSDARASSKASPGAVSESSAGKGGTGGAKAKSSTSAARASPRASPGAVSESSAGNGGKGKATEIPSMEETAKALSEFAGNDEKSLADSHRALNYLRSKYIGNADKPEFQIGLAALMGSTAGAITMQQFSHWLVDQAGNKTLYDAVSKYQVLEPRDKTPLKTLLDMAYKTAVEGILRLKPAADGTCVDVNELQDEEKPYGTKNLLDLRRNGEVEVTADYGARDCLPVAFNNAFGGVFLLRNTKIYTTSSIKPLSIVDIDDRFAEGDLCVKKLLPIINNKKRTPFVVTKDNGLSGTFDVFLKPRGIYVIALVLVDTAGRVNSHAVTLDCERNYVNFGYGTDSDGQIVLHFAGKVRRRVKVTVGMRTRSRWCSSTTSRTSKISKWRTL